MKKQLLSAIIFTSVLFSVNAQTTIVDSVYVGGEYRSYILYVPAMYNGATARPLILNLHGYGSDAQEQMDYSGFKPIADTANFLMVYPNGTYMGAKRFWNAGISSTFVNDIAFLNSLIDSLNLTYNIDLNRVYSTGMSNGGYMSHTLACELSDRITAIASVTGSVYTLQYGANCHPTRPLPVMQIHGTLDPTVPYLGNVLSMPIDSVINYWVIKNGCNPVATFSNVPDINTTDGCTAEHYEYSGGTFGSTVELFKIIGGKHTWPGSTFNIGITNMDINASKEIWRFFSKYNLSTLMSTNEKQKLLYSLKLYPNPASTVLSFTTDYKVSKIVISDVLGKIIIVETPVANTISVEKLIAGIYFLSVVSSDGVEAKIKFIKE